MTIIAPSILSCDFLNIESELSSFKEIDNLWIHLDIMDGHFVNNLTFGPPIIKRAHEVTNHPLDAHLMVTHPSHYLESLAKAKVHNFTFHLEAEDNPITLINQAKKVIPSVGISIKPNTPVSSLTEDLLKRVDLILIMSVEPGHGGQKFMPNSLEKAQTLDHYRKENSDFTYQLQIDGGINAETGRQARDHGIDNLVAGSFIFKEGPSTYQSKIDQLRS